VQPDFVGAFEAAPGKTPHQFREAVEKDHGRQDVRRCQDPVTLDGLEPDISHFLPEPRGHEWKGEIQRVLLVQIFRAEFWMSWSFSLAVIAMTFARAMRRWAGSSSVCGRRSKSAAKVCESRSLTVQAGPSYGCIAEPPE
jgi:hypothetical protein